MRSLRIASVAAGVAVAACSTSPTAPALDPTSFDVFSDVVFDPADALRATYTFDELAENCALMVQTAGLYEDLSFSAAAQLAPCATANGTVGLRGSGFFGTSAETRIGLPRPASAVSIESFLLSMGGTPTLTAYDATGAVVGSASDGTPNQWVELAVDGAGVEIVEIGLTLPGFGSDADNLTVAYVDTGEDPGPDPDPEPDPEPEPDPAPSADPVAKEDCLDGGWAAYGFDNQGQCVRFVETGKDSRG